MASCFDFYKSIWCVDFEFGTPAGELPEVRCMAATEYRSGTTHRLWIDGVTDAQAPFTCGPDDLFVAYLSSAELNCYRCLGWTLPENVLDLYVEFVRHLNGTPTPGIGRGLVDALAYFNLPSIDAFEKTTMRDLALRGKPYTGRERTDLLEYCAGDVTALCRLLPHFFELLPDYKSASRALYAGRYMKAVSAMETCGVPIDGHTLRQLRASWDKIKARVTWRVNLDYDVYVPAKLGRTNAGTRQGQAILARARELGVSATHLGKATYELLDRAGDTDRGISRAIEEARRKTGLTVFKIAEWERSGRDHSSYPQLDVMARELASESPELALGPAYGDEQPSLIDLAENLWELLRWPTPAITRDFDTALNEASVQVDTPPDADLDVPLRFSAARFAAWCVANGVPWPRLESGELDLKSDTFKEQASGYPAVSKLRELRETLSSLNLFRDLAVGDGCRNRTMLSPYRARTSRNQPSNSRYIFGPHVWVRNLIQPEPGQALAYIDWSQQEAAIGAALSQDRVMMACYRDGDFYLNFAIACGEAPAGATKSTHGHVRELYKRACLGIQYRMGQDSLAAYLGTPVATARRILRQHRDTFWRFWKWSEEAIDRCHLAGSLNTVFGWPVHLSDDPNPRSLGNHPCQGNGAEMMRLAACLMVERGVRVVAPVHDAFLIEAAGDAIDAEVARARDCMREASMVVLDGFEVKTDVKIFRYPQRFADVRGQGMWDDVMTVLGEFQMGSGSYETSDVVVENDEF
jgi:hypothetical protein